MLRQLRLVLQVLFDLLAAEPDPGGSRGPRALAARLHPPYPDGNGRLARFLMNALLAAGGYPWTVVLLQDGAQHMAALESASIDSDIRPFAKFLSTCMRKPANRDS